jgi:hypothetical protein
MNCFPWTFSWFSGRASYSAMWASTMKYFSPSLAYMSGLHVLTGGGWSWTLGGPAAIGKTERVSL